MISTTVTISGAPLERLREIVDPETLQRDMMVMARKVAFLSLRRLVLTCSVDTGRARGGFLALLDKYGVQSADVLAQRSPLQGGRISEPKERTPGSGITEGRELGTVNVDAGGNVSVTNAVEYVEFINSGTSRMSGTSFLDITMVKMAAYVPKLLAWYVQQRELSNTIASDIKGTEGWE